MISLKNGQPCPQVDSQDRAFLYGDGFFTTVKVEHGMPLLWTRHIDRLIECADQLTFDLDIERLEYDVQQFLHQHSDATGILKVIVSRGVGQRGYLPPEQPADIHIQFFPAANLQIFLEEQQAIDTGFLQLTLGHVMPALAGLKTLNRLEQVLLRQELETTAWVEALVTDIHGHIIEGVSSNCFFYTQGKWLTPMLDQAGIKGVMRTDILHHMSELDIAHQITHIPRNAMDCVEAMFFCNALTGIVPVQRLEHHILSIQPVQQLLKQLKRIVWQQ